MDSLKITNRSYEAIHGGRLGVDSTAESFIKAVSQNPTRDPKLKKRNEQHLKQCLSILHGVQAYIEEREEEKSKHTNMLDRIGTQSQLIKGLPELAMKKLTREKETTDQVTDPRRFRTE